MPISRFRRLAVVLPATLLLACGDDPTPPGPFADVAGDYDLQTVNGSPLPYNTGGSEWLFERRLQIQEDGRFSEVDVLCTQSGESCPRRTAVYQNAFTQRTSDGGLLLQMGASFTMRGAPQPSGGLVITVTNIAAGGGPANTVTLEYRRR